MHFCFLEALTADACTPTPSGCYRDTLMGTGSDLGAASCIDNVLGCGGRSSMGKLSCDSSFSAFSEQDLYPGAISVCMLAEDDMEPGPARPAFAAKPEPLSLLQNSMPSLASDSPVTSESMQSEQSGVLAFVPMDQQGVDGWVPRKHSDPESPLSSSVASLSAVSSMASLSTMVHIGGAASPCDPQLLQQQQKHHADLVRAAERLGNLHNSGALPASNFCSAAPLPMCPTPRGAADAMAGPSRVSGAPSAPGVGGEGCEASGSGVRASMRPRRAAAFVPMPLAGRAKKRGSAANNTCKIAPNPNGHACTACGATVGSLRLGNGGDGRFWPGENNQLGAEQLAGDAAVLESHNLPGSICVAKVLQQCIRCWHPQLTAACHCARLISLPAANTGVARRPVWPQDTVQRVRCALHEGRQEEVSAVRRAATLLLSAAESEQPQQAQLESSTCTDAAGWLRR